MKKTLILLAVFLAVGAFVYVYEYKGGLQRERARERELSLLIMESDDVQSVSLIRGDQDTLTYVRGDGGTWRIISPVSTSVEESSIQANVRAFTDAEIRRRLTVNTQTLGDFGLDPPEAEVLISKTDGTGQHLLVGKETPTRGDIFVSLVEGVGGQDSTEILVTANTVRVQAKKSLFDLRDKKIVHFDDRRVNRIQLVWDGNDIELGHSEGQWTMMAPKELLVDEGRISSFLRNLRDYSAKAFVSETWEDPEPYGFDRPSVRVGLTLGQERTTKEIVVGNFKDEDDAYFAYESGRSPVFLIRESSRNALAKEPFYFEQKELIGIEEEKISQIRFSGAYRWTLVQEDTLDWFAHGDTSLKVESSRMNGLHSALRSLRVTSLVTYEPDDLANYGLRIPFLQVVVKGTGGEESGLEIGDGFNDKRYVKRREFPFVYSIPVSQVERVTRWLEELKETELAPLPLESRSD